MPPPPPLPPVPPAAAEPVRVSRDASAAGTGSPTGTSSPPHAGGAAQAAVARLAAIAAASGSIAGGDITATVPAIAAGADDVSAAVASLFAGHAQAYQSLGGQVAAFHQQFLEGLRG
ncbi:PE family protein, partial [Mycobacterium ulcerans]